MDRATARRDAWQFGREASQRVEHVRSYRSCREGEPFGSALKRLRLRQKVSQRALASALQLPLAEIAAMELEERSPRSFDEILWIGAALALNVSETNQLLRADERRELDEEERIVFIKLRLLLAYPFLEQPGEEPQFCLRCGQPLQSEARCSRCGSRAE